MAKNHSLDQMADAIAEAVENQAQAIARALREGTLTPFAARTTERQRLRYYAERWWNADGTDNLPFQEAEAVRVGAEGVARIKMALAKSGPPAHNNDDEEPPVRVPGGI